MSITSIPSNPQPPEKKGLLARAIDAYAESYNNGRPEVICKRNQPDKCKHPDNAKTKECQEIFNRCIEFYDSCDRFSRLN